MTDLPQPTDRPVTDIDLHHAKIHARNVITLLEKAERERTDQDRAMTLAIVYDQLSDVEHVLRLGARVHCEAEDGWSDRPEDRY